MTVTIVSHAIDVSSHRSDGTPKRMGFFTDTSICIGCKACEVACKEWNLVPEDGLTWTGHSYDNTGAIGANSWRHVAFIEQTRPIEALDPQGAGGLRWLMSSDVCKHCSNAACLDVCPTGALMRTEFGTVVVQDDVCNGCGYCVPACPFGVIDRREGDGRVWKCTLCYERLREDMEPACAQACPTSASRTCARGVSPTRGCTAPTARTGSVASAPSSCSSTSPRCTDSPRIRWSPRGTSGGCGGRPRLPPGR